MAQVPEWIKEARNKWEYTGQKRPDFAREPGTGQESVWDYPRPPVVKPDSRHVIIKLDDDVICETRSSVRILETAGAPVFYFSQDDINMDYLESGSGSSMCEWKGNAVYWTVKNATRILRNVGWSYPDPFEDYSEVKDLIAFYPTDLACYVDGERVRPQPGGFYGGWVTSEIVGPIKGEPGISG